MPSLSDEENDVSIIYGFLNSILNWAEFFDTKIQEVLTIAKVSCLMLKLNDLGSKYQIPLQRNNSSYGKVATGRNRIEEFGFMDEYRIKRYYAEASSEFKTLFERGKLKPDKAKEHSDQ